MTNLEQTGTIETTTVLRLRPSRYVSSRWPEGEPHHVRHHDGDPLRARRTRTLTDTERQAEADGEKRHDEELRVLLGRAEHVVRPQLPGQRNQHNQLDHHRTRSRRDHEPRPKELTRSRSTPGVTAHYTDGRTTAVLALTSTSVPLVLGFDNILVPADNAYGALSCVETMPHARVVIPGGGWRVHGTDDGGVPWSDPVLAWVVNPSGEGAAVLASPDGGVRIDDGTHTYSRPAST